MRKFMESSNFESLEDVEDLLKNYYLSINTRGIDFESMAKKVISSEKTSNGEMLSNFESLFPIRFHKKMNTLRTGLWISACVLTLSLVPVAFYASPNWLQEAYASVQRFLIPLSVLESNDKQKLISIINSYNSPSLSELGNPTPARPEPSTLKVPSKMRGFTGPFNVTVKSGHAHLLASVTTLKGGIAVEGNFYDGGYIICIQVNSGRIYTSSVKVGKVIVSSNYIATPPGTYDVYIASTKSTSQSYSSINVYFN
ncbi:hypothetical protein [Alicyclobacillus cellulosilyticus]|uniref:hypothetical protein n=1 Tax=Alicyclobacillus cellulosilyticus TaxID=1003997 RepID=UPI001663BADA|nr:hypothetical protein [Alicyclobacillus cellulosilyticus]